MKFFNHPDMEHLRTAAALCAGMALLTGVAVLFSHDSVWKTASGGAQTAATWFAKLYHSVPAYNTVWTSHDQLGTGPGLPSTNRCWGGGSGYGDHPEYPGEPWCYATIPIAVLSGYATGSTTGATKTWDTDFAAWENRTTSGVAGTSYGQSGISIYYGEEVTLAWSCLRARQRDVGYDSSGAFCWGCHGHIFSIIDFVHNSNFGGANVNIGSMTRTPLSNTTYELICYEPYVDVCPACGSRTTREARLSIPVTVTPVGTPLLWVTPGYPSTVDAGQSTQLVRKPHDNYSNSSCTMQVTPL